MARYRRKKKKPFVKLARHRQKDGFISVRNKIRRAQRVLGGLFYTHDYMHDEIQWVDGYFLGSVPLFYNFALETAVYAFKEACMDAAWDESEKIVPRQDDLLRGVKDPVSGLWVTRPKRIRQHPEFGGLTRVEWVMKRAKEIADSGTIEVYEEVTLHRDYAHGIGLHGTLNVPALNIEAINAFIPRFLETEKAFRSEEPIIFTSADVAHWGLDSNAIVEPWDYAKAEAEAAEAEAAEAEATEASERDPADEA